MNEEDSNDKDQKLALFQEITHLDDFEQCQAILESTNWDIDQAMQSYFSGATNATETQTEEVSNVNRPHFEHIDIPPIVQKPELKRLIAFNIEYLNKKFQLHVPDNVTVYKLKQLIEEEINVPIDYQKITGWLNKSILVTDSTKLSDLYLPGDVNLHVVNTSSTSEIPASSSTKNDHPKTYELSIKLINPLGRIKIINQSSTFQIEENEQSEDRVYRLNFESTTTFIDIRRAVSKLTKTIANNQEWFYFKDENNLDELKNCDSLNTFQTYVETEQIFGLSLNSLVEDRTSLSEIKGILDDLTHSENSKSTPAQSNHVKLGFVITLKDYQENPFEDLLTITKPEIKPQEHMDTHENDEFDEDNIMEDDIGENFLNEESTIKKQKPLVPIDFEPSEEALCSMAFNEEFTTRYGPLTPLFLIGTLEDAIQETLLCPAKDRKLLGIYLHSDQTIFHNIFCSKTLCDENVVNFLSANFAVWPWDITNKKFETYFHEKCSKYLGSVFTSSLRGLKDKLPVFLVVTRVRGSNEVAAIIQGDSTNDQMINRLMQTYEMFEMQRMNDERDEQTRDERERIKREQDAAFQESLEADKAKRQRQAEEEEKVKKQAQFEAEMERKKEEDKINRQLTALENLPDEPGDNEPKTSRIRFRLPDGEFVQRKFKIQTKLQSLVDFMTSKGYFVEEYKLLSSWPRKDLTNENLDKTIEDLKLFPQETLTLEERS